MEVNRGAGIDRERREVRSEGRREAANPGILLVLHRCDTSTAQVLHCVCTGTALLLHRRCIGVILIPYWRHTTLVLHKSCPVDILWLHWNCTGIVVFRYWYCTETALVLPWYGMGCSCTGDALARHCYYTSMMGVCCIGAVLALVPPARHIANIMPMQHQIAPTSLRSVCFQCPERQFAAKLGRPPARDFAPLPGDTSELPPLRRFPTLGPSPRGVGNFRIRVGSKEDNLPHRSRLAHRSVGQNCR